MSTLIHTSLSVRGALRWSKREMARATEWILKADGSKYTTDELREALMSELAKGNEFVPMGECSDFDPKNGCRGHKVDSEAA